MKKIRSFFATIALLAALSGLLPLGAGLGSLANTASSVSGHSAYVATARPAWPCPTGGGDC